MINVVEESNALNSVEKDLKAIALYLHSITSVLVLQDAEAKQYSNAAMKIWLSDLKSVVYDMDDLLDVVATDALQRSVNRNHIYLQLRYIFSLTSPILRFDLSCNIKDLHQKLERIVTRKNDFGLSDRPVEAPIVQKDVFDACGYVNKLAIVGRDEAKNNIISRLSSLRNECSLSVLPILGMGGIGKTALARLVYHDIDQFDIKLWACVSDRFDIQKILEDILKDTNHENTSNYSLGNLVKKVQDLLKGKKFFIVLDDMWEEDVLLWLDLKDVLNVGERGSVILITTRLENVSCITKTVSAHDLDKLSDSVCWSIFTRLAFADGEEERYPILGEIGMHIVKKCCGNPLVVQSLACLLRTEREEGEWQRIKDMDNLNQLDGKYIRVKQLLKLSYDKLPPHLKPGFAHLSLFAKDCVYAPYYQFYFCSALGLLQLSNGSYFKNNFFNELLSRSMLQDIEWKFTKTINTFKIHDLLHDVAEDILGEDCYGRNSRISHCYAWHNTSVE